ncbi:MAG: hypothetical protein ACRCZS_08290 [Chroococcidiopsis sp.]
MITARVNQNGVILQSGQGISYWVLGDLYTFKTVSKDTNGAYVAWLGLKLSAIAMQSLKFLPNLSILSC